MVLSWNPWFTWTIFCISVVITLITLSFRNYVLTIAFGGIIVCFVVFVVAMDCTGFCDGTSIVMVKKQQVHNHNPADT